MQTVKAITSFYHGGNRRRGSKFQVSDSTALDLASRGLVSVVVEAPKVEAQPVEGNSQAAGRKWSASPAARASRRRTATRSTSGEQAQTTDE